jgi:hypothetical protein
LRGPANKVLAGEEGENVERSVTGEPGLVRLLQNEPTEAERYAHAFALLALVARIETAESDRSCTGSEAGARDDAIGESSRRDAVPGMTRATIGPQRSAMSPAA